MSALVVRVARIVLVMLLLGIGSLLSTGTAVADRMLQELLAEPATGATSAVAGAPETASDYITVTWLIHDVTVWRIDRVFLPSKGEPFIVTQEVWDSSNAATARHHRSPDPAALTSLLEKLGLTAAEQPDVELDTPATAAGWWLLGGLVVGIAACVLTIRYVPVVHRRVLACTPAAEPDRPGDEPVRMAKLPV